MANNLFNVGGPLGPITPGGSGFANPLAQLGFGIYQGNPLAAMQGLAQQQQAGAQLAMLQEQMRIEAEQRRQAAQAREAAGGFATAVGMPMANALFPNLLKENRQAIERGLQEAPVHSFNMLQAMQPTPEKGTTLARNAVEAGLVPGTPEYQAFIRENMGKGPLVSITQAPTGYERTPSGELAATIGGPADPRRITPAEAGKARTEGRLLQKGYADVQELIDLVRKHGSEATGPIGQRMRVLHGSVTMGTGVARGMGALQAHEAEVLAEQITNPAALGSYAMRNETMLSGLEAIRDEMKEAIGRYPAEAGVEVPGDGETANAGTVAQPQTQADYDALPSGTEYLDPDSGLMAIKP